MGVSKPRLVSRNHVSKPRRNHDSKQPLQWVSRNHVYHFKEVNDAHGHLVGDECLREIALRIMEQMRWPQDLATRYGGEEFCVVLPETGEEGAMTVAERIRISVETEPVTCNKELLNLTVSVGINVNVPASDAEATDFFAIADKALYQAKSNGRNCSVSLD